MFKEEAPGVFSVASRFVDGMNGVIVGQRGAIAIDCSNYVDEAFDFLFTSTINIVNKKLEKY